MGFSKLKKVVGTLDLSFLDRFQRLRRRKIGRRGFPTSSYVKAWLIKHILGIPSEAQLVRRLGGFPELRRMCGFRKVPHRTSFCRARKRFGLRGIDFLFSSLVVQARGLGLAKGRLVAVDSTDYTAYCNGRKKLKDRSDKFARWGHSTTKGRVFGYKAHIACDVESELPLEVVVLPASRHDTVGFFPLFERLQRHFSFHIQKLIADCGYDATEIYQKLKGIVAVIARNGRGHYESEKPKDPDYRKRTAIERLNSRVKLELGLDELKMRGLWAATFHATEALCSMLYAAVGSFLAGFKDWRSIVSLRG
jgi:transposase